MTPELVERQINNFVRDVMSGLTVVELSEKYDIHKSSVYKRLDKMRANGIAVPSFDKIYSLRRRKSNTWDLKFDRLKSKLHKSEILTSRSEYVGEITKIEYICSKKMKHTRSAYGIMRSKYVCKCEMYDALRLSTKQVRDECKRLGFLWTGHDYKSANTNLSDLYCIANNHLLCGRTLAQLRMNNKCSKCHFYLQEEICRRSIEVISGKSFKKTRLPEMKRLELDGYCEELMLAFEYNGIQHYEKVDWYGNGNYLCDSKRRDAKKRRLLRKNGIRLITISYRTKTQNIPFRIFNEFVRRGYHPIVSSPPSVQQLDVNVKSKTSELSEIALKKSWRLVSNAYLGSAVKLKFECMKHKVVFEMTPSKLLLGQCGCSVCRKERGSTKRFSVEEINSRLCIANIKWKCLGETFDSCVDGRKQEYMCTICSWVVISTHQEMFRQPLLCPKCPRVPQHKKYTEEDFQQVVRLRASGMTYKEIANNMNRTLASIKWCIQFLGLAKCR